MTAPTVETPVAPAPAPPSPPSPGQMAADAARRRARDQATDDGYPVPTWVEVTPAMADAWLREFNPPSWQNAKSGETEQQRNQRRQIIEMYARAMARDEWLRTGDPIQFGKSGILLNGQHRLKAVVKARKTVPLLILTDVEDDARVGMDNGIRRSVGDKLAMKGRKYVMHQGSVARLIWDLRARTSKRPDPPSDVELLDMIDSDPTIEWVVTEVMPHLPVLGSKTVSGYCYWLLHQTDAERCAYFFEKLKTLEELPKGSPIAALSARMRNVRAGAWKDKVQAVSMVVSAWNAWRNDEPRERIQARRNSDGYYEVPEVV